jgi:chromosome segregation ATPase
VIESLTEALKASEERQDRAMCNVFEIAQSPLQIKAGRALSDQEALQVGKLVEGARRLASERERTLGLRTELATRRTEHNDLRFQIDELKEQLQALQGAATVDQQLAHDEVTRLLAQIQAKLEAMAPYSNRVALHFSQFPELRNRLSAPPQAVKTSNPG